VSVSSFDMSRIVVVAIAASLFGSAALAQDSQQPTPQPAQQPQNPQSDPVAAVVGAWELSNADHDKTCRLNFRADAGGGDALAILEQGLAGPWANKLHQCHARPRHDGNRHAC